MASTFSLHLLSLLGFLLLNSQFSYATTSNSNSPKGYAENLIRALNLTPKDGTFTTGGSAMDPPIVEKGLRVLKGNKNGTSPQDLGQHAGYFALPHTYNARMFYFFFESRKSKADPVVIWLTGGPGCSSELAVFYENGPFHITNNISLVSNDFGWDQASNLLFVDQPTGTGFSYSGDNRDLRHNENGVSNDLYNFLQVFFEKYPQYANNSFYITGESYAGHYIPAFASRVQQGNNADEGIHINLKGLAIGNGLTDPAIQYRAYTDYALAMKIIDQSDYQFINTVLPSCEQAIQQCGSNGGDSCTTAFSTCNQIFSEIVSINDGLNYYDIRKKCVGDLCYDFSNVEKYLNRQDVRTALGVGNREFVSCNTDVYDAMIRDWMKNYEVDIPALLEGGIKILVYAGEYDLICNWLGNARWVEAMEWSGQKDYLAAPNVSFVVDGKEAGLLKSHGALSFLKVHNAGHMVPMDQPKAALEMLKRWIQGTLPITQMGGKIIPKR